MKAYLIVFCFAILFIILSEKSFRKDKKNKGFFYIILSLFAVCFVAGVRNLDVGIDIKYYLQRIFFLFSMESKNILSVYKETGVEIGFVTYIGIVSLTKNINFVFFMVEFLVAAPIYYIAYKKRKESSMILTIIIFLLTIYCRSLNIMRQSIACSLVMLSLYFFEQGKNNKAFVWCLIATLFHSSAIIGTVVLFISYICRKQKKIRINVIIGIVTLIILLLPIFSTVLKYIPKYSRYLNTMYLTSSMNLMSILKKLVWIIFGYLYLCLYKNKEEEKYARNLSYVTFLVVDLILYGLTFKIASAGRIGLYFLYTAYIMFLPNIKDIFKNKMFANMMVIIILTVFWYNMTIINYESDGIYPYKSDIFQFLNEGDK